MVENIRQIKEVKDKLEDVRDRLDKEIARRNRIKEDITELLEHQRHYEFEMNKMLANDLVKEIRLFFSEIPVERFDKIHKIMLDMQTFEGGYYKNLENPKNPYDIEFKDANESAFLQKLFANGLKPTIPFNKFIIYMFSQKEANDFVKAKI